MAQFHEKRNYSRHHHEAAIKHQLDGGVFRRAHMYNYSQGGLYFETEAPLLVGSKIFIGIENSPLAKDARVYECIDGEVRWCRRKEDDLAEEGYAVGVEFDEPIRIKR